MNLEDITPDQVIYFSYGEFSLNATILFSWLVMLILTFGSYFATRSLKKDYNISTWQNFLEVVVGSIRDQIVSVSKKKASRYLPFIGTLFLFIAFSNLLMIIPGFVSPMASLSTTMALALCVFVSVPIFGIASEGLRSYLLHYIRLTPLMLPFNIIGELSRTLALAVRLFGNIMSGTKIVAILMAIAPLIFPILMNILGLLTGLIQAYIFAILAIVYIASASSAHEQGQPSDSQNSHQDKEEISRG